MAYKDFTQFPVWRNAFKLLILVFQLTKKYPKEERYGLMADMRRAANSVTHNIPEGYGRFEKRVKSRFYKIARGSAYELISQILVSEALGYINAEEKAEVFEGYKEVIHDLDRLIKSVENR